MENDFWSTGRRVVEELDSDDTDTQGADLATTGNRRFASDPLRFTGIDLGGGAQPRNGHAYQNSDDGDSTEEDSHSHATSEEDTEDENPATRELEEALVQSALSRIRRAQAKGKRDVKLNKEELAALERRRKRLQAEAEAAKRRNGGERKQRKEKEQRYAVPLSQFDAPDAEPSQQLVGPPMGRFPPPSASRSRPRSGTSSTSSTYRPQSSLREPSPFEYQYVHAPPNHRHASDPSARPSSSRLSLPREEDWVPPSSSSRELRDPFQYQTAGPRAPYPDGAAAARLDAAGSDGAYVSVPRKPVPTAVRSSPRRAGSREERNEQEREDETTSDDGATGARIGRNGSRGDIVVEPASPSPERPKSKKHSPPSQSTAKRKSASGRKRKGK